MMKKATAALCLVLAAALVLAACGTAPAEIVLVPDVSGVEDKSFNAAIWEGVRLYAGVNDKTANFYQLAGPSDDERLNAIGKGAGSGAQVVVLAGGDFAFAASTAQAKWPDVHFIVMDGTVDGGPTENTVSVTFAQQEAGFLAGWAAVAEGYTQLGFLGGAPLPGVTGYGLGFALGLQAAAKALDTEVSLRYAYNGRFEENAEALETAAEWYRQGTEVIFACGGGMNQSVFRAAEENEGKAIGSDVDQAEDSAAVLFSAVKDTGAATGRLLESFYGGSFPAGQEVVLAAGDGVVGLALENSRLEHFTLEAYEDTLALLTQDGFVLSLEGTGSEAPLYPEELKADLSLVRVESSH